MTKRRWGSEAGVSLIQAVVFLGVVLLTGAGIYEATTSSKQAMDTAKRTGDAGALTDLSLERLRQLLTDTGADKTGGICRLFSTPLRSVGSGNIYLRVPALRSEDPLLADWDRAFPPALWDSVDQIRTCQRDAFTRCYKPKTGLPGIPDTFIARQPVVTASLIPVYMRNTGGSAVVPVSLSPSSSYSVNARDIGLVLSVKISVRDGDAIKQASTGYATVWTGQLTCGYITADGKHFYLNPSAIGSGNVSDPSAPSGSGTVFSLMNTPSRDSDQVIDVAFHRYENTQWTVDGAKLKSDYSSGTVASVCREEKFHCPAAGATRTWLAQGLAVETGVKYVPNTRIDSQSVVLKPQIYFSRRGGASPVTGNATYQQSGTDIPAPFFVTIPLSPRVITARFTDGNAMCSQICTAPSYNTGADPLKPTFTGTPRADFANAGTMGPFQDSSPTFCSCCADKQCARSGYQSYLACSSLGPEPLDSRYSECEGSDPARVYGHTVYEDLDNTSFDPNSCVTAQADGGGNLTFASHSCADTLPALCYYQGQTVVTRSLDTRAQVSGSFDASRQACYRLGDERLDAAELRNRMTLQGTTDMLTLLGAPSGSSYRFVNAASAGLFVAPETDPQLTAASNGMTPIAGLGPVWIALRTDSSRRFYSPPPELDSAWMSSVGYYTDPNKRMIIFQDTASVSSGSNLLLAHSRKFFGPVASSGTAPAGTRVLCRSTTDSRLLITSATVTDVTAAADACRAEGGLFLPPLRSNEWHYALNLAARPSADYPWPDAGGVANTAWVGFQKTASGYRLALAPAEGTAKVNWKGAAVSGAATHRLCVKRTGTKPSFKLMTGSPLPACVAPFSDYGLIRDDAIVDTQDLLLFLAARQAAGDLDDTSVVELNAP